MPASRDPELWECARQVADAAEQAALYVPLLSPVDIIYSLLERGIIEVGENLNRKVSVAERRELLEYASGLHPRKGINR